MVKTLRITSVIVVLLAIGIFALPVIYGVKTDENIENFLNGPDLIEVFNATSGNRTTTPANQVHPLVSQAEIFKNIIDPPKQIRKEPIKNIKTARNAVNITSLNTPKFELKSTSVNSQNPEMSLALIQEGKRTFWVRQAGTVNHLTI
jgi:hypothetical protein